MAPRADYFRFLRSVYFFASLDDEEVRAIREVCREERFAAEEVVFTEGSVGDKFYIVLDGTVQVWKGPLGSAELLAEHGEGHLFGEMSLVDDLPRSATIRAKTPARLLSMSRSDFQRIVASNAGIALSLLKSISSMVRTSNETYVDALRRRNAELERLYDDLKRSQGEALRNDRLAALGRFASLILHDIRNPLSTIRAYAELIIHSIGSRERVTESAKTIIRESDRLGGLVSELLDYARGEIRLSLSPVSVAALVGRVVDGLEARFAAAGIRTELALHYDEPILLDEARMLRVLHNLADNAVKAMPHGGVFAVGAVARGRRLEITISDTGVGMSAETMKRLFEPFFSSFEGGGTGLGMAISRSIVRAHRGELSARSEHGKGTTFIVSLPTSLDTLP